MLNMNKFVYRHDETERDIPGHESEQYFGLCTNVFDGRRSRPDLAAQHIVEHLRYIFFPFEIYSVKILQH